MKTALAIFAALAVMTDSTVAARKTPVGETCVDNASNCPRWAAQKHCTRSARYMKKHCAKSCGFCSPADDKMKKLQTDLKQTAEKLVGSLNKDIADMDKPWDSQDIVSVVKKDTEIVAQIRNNGKAISENRKAFSVVVDEIKHQHSQAEAEQIASLKSRIAEDLARLEKAKGKQGVDFKTSLDSFGRFFSLYNKEKQTQTSKVLEWTEEMKTAYAKYNKDRKYWSEFNYAPHIKEAEIAHRSSVAELHKLQPNAAKKDQVHACTKKHTVGQCKRCTNSNQCGIAGKSEGYFCCPGMKLCLKRGNKGCSSKLVAGCKTKKEFSSKYRHCYNHLTAEKCTCQHKDWNSGKWQKPTCEK